MKKHVKLNFILTPSLLPLNKKNNCFNEKFVLVREICAELIFSRQSVTRK